MEEAPGPRLRFLFEKTAMWFPFGREYHGKSRNFPSVLEISTFPFGREYLGRADIVEAGYTTRHSHNKRQRIGARFSFLQII